MGRPLLSTLIAPAAAAATRAPEPAVRVAEPEEENKNLSPTYERWSYINAFDPDSDEFFEDAMYEAFLSAEEIAERERQREGGGESVPESNVRADGNASTDVRVPVSTQAAVRSRLMDLRAARAAETVATAPVPGEDERPELVSPTADDSSSSGSDTTSSGRASPAETDGLLDLSRLRARRDSSVFPWHPADLEDELISAAAAEEAAPVPQSVSRSLPTTPTRSVSASGPWWEAMPPLVSPPADRSAPIDIDIPAPASPMPPRAQAVALPPSPSPMTPPGSVTPRFLTWAGSGTRPRAIDMSPSPTPVGPFGSARAAASHSRMSLSYISPPALRVQL